MSIAEPTKTFVDPGSGKDVLKTTHLVAGGFGPPSRDVRVLEVVSRGANPSRGQHRQVDLAGCHCRGLPVHRADVGSVTEDVARVELAMNQRPRLFDQRRHRVTRTVAQFGPPPALAAEAYLPHEHACRPPREVLR